MNYKLTLYTKERVDYDGYKYEAKEWHFDCPFESGQNVYYAYLERRLFRKNKWVVRKSRIVGIWATNIYGVTLDNNEHIHEDLFDRLFVDREEAIEFCLKKNRQAKVKIYNE